MFRLSAAVAITLLVSAAGCSGGRHSPAGFRLPAYGDAERGKVAFTTLRCHDCHQVSGVDLPKPTVQPPVPVVLGGDTVQDITDGYLVASVINPSHAFANYPRAQITTSAGKSRMPEYADNMSVRQLTDIVAFLQSRYRTVHANRYPPYAHANGHFAR